MLPTGHIEFTWATLNLLQRRRGWFQDADYRLVGLAALAPDLLDKPLALTVYRNTDAALFWGHNLWFHIGVWLAAATWAYLAAGIAARHKASLEARGPAPAPASSGLARLSAVLPYLLAFSGHLIADRMWGFQESLFYPLGTGSWHRWVHVGAPTAMMDAYLEIVRTTPLLVAFELIGLALLAWLVWDRRLWRKARLLTWLRTGRFEVRESD